MVANVFSSNATSAGVFPDWIFSRASARGSLPTRVSSTSVSGRKTRCWRGSSTLRNPESAAPGSRTRTLVSASDGRSTRSSTRGSIQSSPPVSSKVDEADSGGNSYRNCPSRTSTMTDSRVAPSAVRSRTTTARGVKLPGLTPEHQRLAPAEDDPVIFLRLEFAAGPAGTSSSEAFVAGHDEPAAGVEAQHRQVRPLRPAFGRTAEPPGEAQSGGVGGADGEDDRDEQGEDQGPGVDGGPLAVPELTPVRGGQRLARPANRQPHHRRRRRRAGLRQAVRGAARRQRSAGRSPAGIDPGSSPATARPAPPIATAGSPGRPRRRLRYPETAREA